MPQQAVDTAARLLPPGPVYIGFAPGAGGRHKCWPIEAFMALAERQGAAGRVPVFVLGPAERDWLDELRRRVPSARFPLQDAGSADPLLTVALAGRMTAAVANDSGGGHLLAAGGVALVSLFGPTSPAKFAPLARKLKILRAQDFGGEAMTAIPVDAVAAALDELI